MEGTSELFSPISAPSIEEEGLSHEWLQAACLPECSIPEGCRKDSAAVSYDAGKPESMAHLEAALLDMGEAIAGTILEFSS